jgi:hypothetical protein
MFNAIVVGGQLQRPTLDLADSMPCKGRIQGERIIHVLQIEVVRKYGELVAGE